MNRRVSLTLIAIALVGGCTFNAPAPTSYRCSTAQPACPAGQTCVGNLCVSSTIDARPDQRREGQPRVEAAVDGKRLDGPRIDDGKKLDGKKLDGPRVDLPKVDGKKTDGPKVDLPKPCGNGVIDPGEQCDSSAVPPFPSGVNCITYKRNGGSLTCTSACKIDVNLPSCCLAAVPPPGLTNLSRIVSITVGSDMTTQPLCSPYKTITKALATAPQGSSVWVMPGNYTQSAGEGFPILLTPTVSLIGDEPNKGGSSSPTLISGAGSSPAVTGLVTIVGANAATLAGFRIVGPATAGAAIVVPGLPFNIRKNTIEGLNGVRVEPGTTSSACPLILDNVFNASGFGVQTDCSSTQIQSNLFKSSTGILHLAGGASIHTNTFDGCQDHGAQITGGNPVLTNNTFAGGIGAFSKAAVSVGMIGGAATAVTPKIRGGSFPALQPLTAIKIVDSGKPDLGTQSDPGNLKFGVTRVVLSAPNTIVNAIGNEWALPSTKTPSCIPPGSTGQIQVTGASSSVIWGPGPADHCPL